ncbi:MAG: TonB-dependent receptor [Bacteriovoracia bacterium]
MFRFSVLILVFNFPAFAETLEPIVVEDKTYRDKLISSASSLTIIDKEDIEKDSYNSLAQVLQNLPGVTIAQSGSFGKTG